MTPTAKLCLKATMPLRLHGALRTLIGVAALLAFAVLALNLRQSAGERAYDIEREPMAAAVSHIVYRAPLGTEFEAVRNDFINSNSPIEHKLTAVTERKIDLGRLLPHTLDGLGVGFPLFATAAMLIFGLHTDSLIIGFLCLQSVAGLVFLFRFTDARALIIPLYFTALAAMLITPIGTDPSIVSQIPVGGYRYFALLAVIPALHITLEMIDKADYPPTARRMCLLTAQALLLICVYVVNASILYLTVPIILIGTSLAIWRRKNRKFLVLLAKKFGSLVVVAIIGYGIFYSIILASYRQTGKIGDLFWHRIFISYGANPAWPFGNTAEVYSACKREIPRGMVSGIVDQDGECVWITYGTQRGFSPTQMHDGLYGVEYEKVIKAAFFNVFFSYPRQSLKTFFYYKPTVLLETLKALLTFAPKAGILRYSILIIEVFLLFGLAGLENVPPRPLTTMAAAIGITGAGTLSMYFAAWSNPWTTSDLVCYLFMLIGLTPIAAICFIRRSGERVRVIPTAEAS